MQQYVSVQHILLRKQNNTKKTGKDSKGYTNCLPTFQINFFKNENNGDNPFQFLKTQIFVDKLIIFQIGLMVMFMILILVMVSNKQTLSKLIKLYILNT